MQHSLWICRMDDLPWVAVWWAAWRSTWELGKLGSSPSFTIEIALVTWASVFWSVADCLLKAFFSHQNFQGYVMTMNMWGYPLVLDKLDNMAGIIQWCPVTRQTLHAWKSLPSLFPLLPSKRRWGSSFPLIKEEVRLSPSHQSKDVHWPAGEIQSWCPQTSWFLEENRLLSWKETVKQEDINLAVYQAWACIAALPLAGQGLLPHLIWVPTSQGL